MSPSPKARESILPIRTVRLDNGMRVVVCEAHGAPVVALQVWVEVGSADEKIDEGGLAHVHEHMLFKGTKKRAVGAIASEVEAAGGEINAWTSYDQTVYHVVIAAPFFDAGLDILSDAIQESAFDAGELSRELEVILEEIKRGEDQPTSRVSRALFETAFTTHPYRRPVIGKSEVVKAFTREKVLSFFDAHYRADRLTVVCVGDIDADVAIEKIQAAFANCGTNARPLPPRDVEPPQTAARVKGLTDDVEESHVAIGWRCPELVSEDTPAVDVLAVILGQGTSSRLVEEIRERRALVNEVYAYAYTPRDAGLFVVGASLAHDKIDEAVAAIGKEIARLVDEGVTADEIEKAKTILSADSVYQRETAEGLARRLGYWVTMTGNASFERVYQDRIRAVTAGDVASVANKILHRDGANLIALVPNAEAARVTDEKLMPLVTSSIGPRRVIKTKAKASSGGRSIHQLASGATLVVERDHINPIVAVRAAWLGGVRAEDDITAGHSYLFSEMVTRGTANHSASSFARATDSIAGQVDGYAGKNSVGLRGTFLRKHLDRGLDLFTEVLREPTFPDDELRRVKHLVLEDLKSRQDNPSGLVFDLFARTLWQTHPYRREIVGTEKSITDVTSAQVRAMFERHMDPTKAVISVVGDVDVDAIAIRIEEATRKAAWSSASPSTWTPAREQAPSTPRVARLERDRAQAHVLVGHRGLTMKDDERFALEVLSATLAGQGGRLFLELRDRQSLCYSVSAFAIEGLDPGSFAIYMGTSPDKVDRALAGIETVLDDLLNRDVPDGELARAKRYLIGSHDIGLQRLGARATTTSLNVVYGMGHENHLRYPERIAAVTSKSIRAVAQAVLNPATRVTAIVGNKDTGGPEANIVPGA